MGCDRAILVFGDSITFGYWDELGGWVNRLRMHFDKFHNPDGTYPPKHWRVYNLGIPGQTVEGILQRFEIETGPRKKPQNIVILQCGINDAQIIDGKVRTSKAEFIASFSSLLDKARELTDLALVLGLTPVDESRLNPIPWDPSKAFSDSVVAQYDTLIREVCEKKGCNYLALRPILSTTMLEDGCHPNTLGHQEICKHVLQKLQSLGWI